MGYYLAPALATLRGEFNNANPNRDKNSDGWIGDDSHAARKSDHNPDYDAGGVVRAYDVDKDGTDLDKLLQIAVRDNRVQYVIWQRRIYSRIRNFVPAVYTGSSPHTEHMHISLRHGKEFENDTISWGYGPSTQIPAPPAPTPAPPVFLPPVFLPPVFPLPPGFYFGPKTGPRESVSGYFSYGADLARWQEQMRHRGWKIGVDGRYGDETGDVAEKFQREKGLVPDRKIGPQTWAAAWTAPVS